jgi:hypothetical protein
VEAAPPTAAMAPRLAAARDAASTWLSGTAALPPSRFPPSCFLPPPASPSESASSHAPELHGGIRGFRVLGCQKKIGRWCRKPVERRLTYK